MTLDDLRHVAVARSLFAPTTLQRALDTLGFVQADPIRAPARAQDLTLRHRVTGYRAGDLERRYSRLDIHEDVFVNYGFVTGAVQRLMHPRGGPVPWPAGRGRHVRDLLAFVRTRGSVRPRDAATRLAHLDALVDVIVGMYAPLPAASLSSLVRRLRRIACACFAVSNPDCARRRESRSRPSCRSVDDFIL